jgi:hypothetical protein
VEAEKGRNYSVAVDSEDEKESEEQGKCECNQIQLYNQQ